MNPVSSFRFTPDLNELVMGCPTEVGLYPSMGNTDSSQLNLDLKLSPSFYANNNTTNLSATPPSSPTPSSSMVLGLPLKNPTSPFFSALTISPRSKRIRRGGGKSDVKSQNNKVSKLGEKFFSLEKLMPWEKKLPLLKTMDETYNYIMFLQAQISSLQSMPTHSTFQTTVKHNGAGFEGLENLNRQQLLQVVINSSRVQTIFSSKKLCVFSAEQLNRGASLFSAKQNGENGSAGSSLLN